MQTRRQAVLALAIGAGLATIRVSDALATTAPPWRPQWQFVQPTARLTPLAGGHDISLGWCGTRVRLVQQRLGLAPRTEEYDVTTRSAVIAFQRGHGLPPTGVVDERTWAALRTGQPWTIDAWRPAIAVAPTASREQRVEAMIRYAVGQVGSPYVWGGAGPTALGHDCSGLVLAGLAAAGLEPRPVTVTLHQSPGYVTTEALYRHPHLERVPVASRRRGDLVFWLGPDGVTRHVAIYQGTGWMVEAGGHAYGTRVTPFRTDYPGHRLAPFAVRPFTDRVR